MRPMRMTLLRGALAAFFIIGGVLHFVYPSAYLSIMPPWLPWHGELVAISGVCEIAGGVGLLLPALRRLAAISLILLSIAVLPANVQMLLSAVALGKPAWVLALLSLRLPLQLLLIFGIWRASHAAPAESGR